ncbi:hypothetical protein JCM33374_g3314 [Metschnikowia sp. JCM 33374]|nr:hypothetical protein JCM33374_g3314 [Metschnikowia sp. JCM 33374]
MSEPSASSGDTLRPNMAPAGLCEVSSNDTSGAESKDMARAAPSSWAQKVCAEIKMKFIDGFTPVFFASVMGTGMSANLLYNFPYPASWLETCGKILGVVALLLFIVLCTFFALALHYRPKLITQIHRDPALAPAMGCFVMGYTTLITFLHGILGRSWIIGVWVLWWSVVVGSFYTGIVTFFFSSIAKHRDNKNVLEHTSLSMQYLLPVVTLTVASSLGGIIALDLPNTNQTIVTMTVSLVMWALAMIVASIIVTINFWRMFIHKIPKSGQVLTMFLPIGFVGQGAFAILLFAQNCSVLLLEHHDVASKSSYVSFLTATASKNGVDLSHLPIIMSIAIMVTCSLVAFMSMSFGFLLTIFAYMSVFSKMSPFAIKTNEDFLYHTKSKSPFKRVFVGLLKFHRGFWSMTFPLGTMSLASHQFHTLFHGFAVFKVIAAFYAVLVLATTLGCLSGVVYKGFAICVRASVSEQRPPENV